MMGKSKEFKKIKRDILKDLNQINKLITNKDEKDELLSLIYRELKTI